MTHPDPSLRRARLVSVLLLVATFVAGGLAGAGIFHWLVESRHGGPHQPPPSIMGPMPLRDLGLTPEQELKAREIGDRYRPAFEAIRREILPRVQPIHGQMEQELRKILTPEQQKKLDELIERRKHEPPPGPPGADSPPLPPH